VASTEGGQSLAHAAISRWRALSAHSTAGGATSAGGGSHVVKLSMSIETASHRICSAYLEERTVLLVVGPVGVGLGRETTDDATRRATGRCGRVGFEYRCCGSLARRGATDIGTLPITPLLVTLYVPA
jgi:hypothetical protein